MSRRDIDYAERRIREAASEYQGWLVRWALFALLIFFGAGLLMVGMIVLMYVMG